LWWGIFVLVYEDTKWDGYENFEVFVKGIRYENIMIGSNMQNITYVESCKVETISICYLSTFNGHTKRFKLGDILPAYTHKKEFHLGETTRGDYDKNMEPSTFGWAKLYMLIGWVCLSVVAVMVSCCNVYCKVWQSANANIEHQKFEDEV
jgi:hypothetical protein